MSACPKLQLATLGCLASDALDLCTISGLRSATLRIGFDVGLLEVRARAQFADWGQEAVELISSKQGFKHGQCCRDILGALWGFVHPEKVRFKTEDGTWNVFDMEAW